MECKFNPDIAELIKPALSLYLMKLADDVDAPFKLYAEDQPTNEIDDEELFQVMQQRNPEMFNKMLENANKTIRMGKDRSQQQPQMNPAFSQLHPGFTPPHSGNTGFPKGVLGAARSVMDFDPRRFEPPIGAGSQDNPFWN